MRRFGVDRWPAFVVGRRDLAQWKRHTNIVPQRWKGAERDVHGGLEHRALSCCCLVSLRVCMLHQRLEIRQERAQQDSRTLRKPTSLTSSRHANDTSYPLVWGFPPSPVSEVMTSRSSVRTSARLSPPSLSLHTVVEEPAWMGSNAAQDAEECRPRAGPRMRVSSSSGIMSNSSSLAPHPAVPAAVAAVKPPDTAAVLATRRDSASSDVIMFSLHS